MAQCKKILPNGERCSNRALPGAEYCQEHRRIEFRPVAAQKASPPAQAARPAAARNQKRVSAAPPAWVAAPSALGSDPAFPGLRADGRGILVGKQGLLWLPAAERSQDEPPKADLSFARLARLLAALSQEMPLAGRTQVYARGSQGERLVLLSPPEEGPPSLLYDAVAAAADLAGGRLYVGAHPAFIQYRDGSAPRGYDAAGVTLPASTDALYLVDAAGTHPIPRQELSESALPDLLLSLSPQAERSLDVPIDEYPRTVYVLAEPALYGLLARYLRAHHLPYRVGRFVGEQNCAWLLIEVAASDGPGAVVPAFVLSYLQSLPRAAVLVEQWTDDGRRALVGWRQRYPGALAHVAGAFPSGSLLILLAHPDFANMCVSPQPALFEGDDLVAVHSPQSGQSGLAPQAGPPAALLEVTVRLVEASGATPPTAALILQGDEIEWLRCLVYRLPGEAFGAYSLCLGEKQAVLLGESAPVEGLPFGTPLRRVQDTALFLPLRARLTPDLPWALLAQALDIRPEVYTFIAPDFRLDVPRDAFAPLSKSLVAEGGRPRAQLELRAPPALPPLRWTPPPEPAKAQVPPADDGTSSPGLLDRLLRGRKPPEQTMPLPITVTPPPARNDAETWRERGEAYRQEGDYLSAAFCFALAGDQSESGRCYRQAVQINYIRQSPPVAQKGGSL